MPCCLVTLLWDAVRPSGLTSAVSLSSDRRGCRSFLNLTSLLSWGNLLWTCSSVPLMRPCTRSLSVSVHPLTCTSVRNVTNRSIGSIGRHIDELRNLSLDVSSSKVYTWVGNPHAGVIQEVFIIMQLDCPWSPCPLILTGTCAFASSVSLSLWVWGSTWFQMQTARWGKVASRAALHFSHSSTFCSTWVGNAL